MNLPRRASVYLEKGITYPKFDGWCTPEKSLAMMETIFENQPEVFVEIGVFAGKSFVGAAIAMDCLGIGTAYGIDPWSRDDSVEGWAPGDPNNEWWGNVNHEAIYQQCLDFVALFGLEKRTRLLRMRSSQAADLFTKIDMLHIDGNHNKEQALWDVQNYVPKVVPGGLVWFDDCDWATTSTAQEEIRKSCVMVKAVGACHLFRKSI